MLCTFCYFFIFWQKQPVQIALLHPEWKRALLHMFAGLASNPASAAHPHHPAWSDEQPAGQLLAHFRSAAMSWSTEIWGMASQECIETTQKLSVTSCDSLLLLLIFLFHKFNSQQQAKPIALLQEKEKLGVCFLSSNKLKLMGGFKKCQNWQKEEDTSQSRSREGKRDLPLSAKASHYCLSWT